MMGKARGKVSIMSGHNNMLYKYYMNCGIRHVTVPIATRITLDTLVCLTLSVINLVYFKMQV